MRAVPMRWTSSISERAAPTSYPARSDRESGDSAASRQKCRCGEQLRQVIVVHVLDERPQRIALQQQDAFVGGELRGRAVVAMPSDRAGSEHGPIPADHQAPSEVDIFEVGEEPGVESAEVDEHAAVDEHRPAVRERKDPSVHDQTVTHCVGERTSEPLLLAEPVQVDRGVGEVEMRPVPVRHEPCDAHRA